MLQSKTSRTFDLWLGFFLPLIEKGARLHKSVKIRKDA